MLSFEGRNWIFTLTGFLWWSSLDPSLELTDYCNSWIAQNGMLRRDFTPALFNMQAKHQMWGVSDVIWALQKQEAVNWVGLFGWINRAYRHLKPFHSSFHTYLESLFQAAWTASQNLFAASCNYLKNMFRLLLGCVKIMSDKTLILGIASFPVRLSQNNVPTMIYINRGSGLICLFLAYTE